VDVEGIRRVRLGRLSGGGRESGCWGGKAGHENHWLERMPFSLYEAYQQKYDRKLKADGLGREGGAKKRGMGNATSG